MKYIKKIILALCFVLALAGCSDTNEKIQQNTEEATVEIATTEEVTTEEMSTVATTEEITTEEITTEEVVVEPQKKGILIAIDPGHQGPNVDMSAKEPNAPGSSEMKTKATCGTSGKFSGVPEYQLNLDIALMVKDALVEQGYDVIMTREDNDTAISNAERATLANEAGADVSVRIHANGSEDSSVDGALMLIGSQSNPYVGVVYDDSYRLADSILSHYCQATGMANLGIQTNDTMTGINWSQIPVVILEMGFMSNETDDLNMANESYRQKMVEGIVNGINAYYGY